MAAPRARFADVAPAAAAPGPGGRALGGASVRFEEKPRVLGGVAATRPQTAADMRRREPSSSRRSSEFGGESTPAWTGSQSAGFSSGDSGNLLSPLSGDEGSKSLTLNASRKLLDIGDLTGNDKLRRAAADSSVPSAERSLKETKSNKSSLFSVSTPKIAQAGGAERKVQPGSSRSWGQAVTSDKKEIKSKSDLLNRGSQIKRAPAAPVPKRAKSKSSRALNADYADYANRLLTADLTTTASDIARISDAFLEFGIITAGRDPAIVIGRQMKMIKAFHGGADSIIGQAELIQLMKACAEDEIALEKIRADEQVKQAEHEKGLALWEAAKWEAQKKRKLAMSAASALSKMSIGRKESGMSTFSLSMGNGSGSMGSGDYSALMKSGGLGGTLGSTLGGTLGSTFSGSGTGPGNGQSLATLVDAAFNGKLDAAVGLDERPEVRLFVSSTFDDTVLERNYMQEYMFPELASLCSQHGIEFNVVDLRWGVSDETTDDHGGTDLCLEELKRCLNKSLGPAFVFFSSERYGWRALPRTVPEDEFLKLLKFVPEGTAKVAVTNWYQLDSNSVPPQYVLQKISSMRDTDRDLPNWLRDFWDSDKMQGAQSIMQTALRAAVEKANFTGSKLERWMLSVTDKEVMDGLVRNKLREQNCLCVTRRILGMNDFVRGFQSRMDMLVGKDKEPDPVKLRKLMNFKESPELVYSTIPREDQALLQKLRNEKIGMLPASKVMTYDVEWREPCLTMEYHGDYVRALCGDLLVALKESILSAAQQYKSLGALESEVIYHCAFASRRAVKFLGRPQLMEDAARLAAPNQGRLKVIFGASGSGKTSVVCATASRAPQVTLIRCCGTTTTSSSARGVLTSLCKQLTTIYNSQLEVPQEFRALATHFYKLITQYAIKQRPISIFIDSLDQLSDEDQGRSDPLSWLPRDLPPYVALVVSTLTDERLGVLRALQLGGLDPSDDFLEVCSLNVKDAEELVYDWLAAMNRSVSPVQAKEISEAIAECEGGPTMLYLRLLLDVASKWHSYDKTTERLPRSVPAMVEDLFERTEVEFGQPLTARAIALLAASKGGLSQQNLLDLISASDDVLGWKGTRNCVLQYHDPPIRRLPPLVLIRLLYGMREYLVERGGPGTTVLAFYHRQFLDQAIIRYLPSLSSRTFHCSLLADYFSGKSADAYPLRGIASHRVVPRDVPGGGGRAHRYSLALQALSELPSALLQAGEERWEECVSMLTDLDFVDAKCGAGLLDELVGELEMALEQDRAFTMERLAARKGDEGTESAENLPSLLDAYDDRDPDGDGDDVRSAAAKRPAERNRLEDYHRFVTRNAHVLRKAPHLTLQAAANSPPLMAPARDALERVNSAEGFGKPWVEWDNKEKGEDACRMVFEGHAYEVMACAFSNDGKLIATGSADKTARLWEASTGAHLRTFQGHELQVSCVAFGPEAKTLLTGSWDTTAIVWDVTTGTSLRCLTGHTDKISGCAISPNGAQIVTASFDNTAQLWKEATAEEQCTLRGHTHWLTSCAFAPTGKIVVTGSLDFTARLWDTKSGAHLRRLEGQAHWVNAVCFSPDSKHVLTASEDHVARIWDVQTGDVVQKLYGHTRGVACVAFAPSGKTVATGASDKSVRVFDVDTGAQLRTMEGHAGHVNGVAYSPDGKNLLSCSSDRTSRLWEAAVTLPGKDARTSDAHAEKVLACVFTNQGRLITGSQDRTAKLWDEKTGTVIRSFEGHINWVSACAASPNGKLIVTASWDKTARLWEAATGNLLRKLEGHTGYLSACAFSPLGQEILTTSQDKTARMWSAPAGDLLRILTGHNDLLNTGSYSPDGRLVLTASQDFTARLWDAANGSQLRALEGHTASVKAACFSPDSRLVLTASYDKSARVWDASMGACLRILKGHTNMLHGCCFSSDGRHVLTVGTDRTGRLWNPSTGAQFHLLPGLATQVTGSVFNIDSSLVMMPSTDNKVTNIWDTAAGQVRHSFATKGVFVCGAFSPHESDHAVMCDDVGSVYFLRLHSNAVPVRKVVRRASSFGLNSQHAQNLTAPAVGATSPSLSRHTSFNAAAVAAQAAIAKIDDVPQHQSPSLAVLAASRQMSIKVDSSVPLLPPPPVPTFKKATVSGWARAKDLLRGKFGGKLEALKAGNNRPASAAPSPSPKPQQPKSPKAPRSPVPAAALPVPVVPKSLVVVVPVSMDSAAAAASTLPPPPPVVTSSPPAASPDMTSRYVPVAVSIPKATPVPQLVPAVPLPSILGAANLVPVAAVASAAASAYAGGARSAPSATVAARPVSAAPDPRPSTKAAPSSATALLAAIGRPLAPPLPSSGPGLPAALISLAATVGRPFAPPPLQVPRVHKSR